MEMPRHEMEMVDSAGKFDATAMQPWDDIADDDADESWEDWQIEECRWNQPATSDLKPAISVVAATIKTAAALEREANSEPGKGGGVAASVARRVPARDDGDASGVRAWQDHCAVGRGQESPCDDSICDGGAERRSSCAQCGATVLNSIVSGRVYPGCLLADVH